MTVDPPFDLLGPLPAGTTVLEASAGTGKTYTIAGLVTRYVAEGAARLEDLLVVTFGRAATQELRDRVRERLVSARDGLADPAGARSAGQDQLLRLLAAAPDEEVARRQARLSQALAGFDAATVVTTHQFCQQMLIALGTAADVDSDATLVETLDDLVDEVARDLYLRMWGTPGTREDPPITVAEALTLARTVARDSQAIIVPDEAATDSTPDLRRRFANKVRDEVDRRKRARRILGFDDLLSRLQQTLADPDTGAAAAARLRARYRVVLVDEFQDTDPVQWDILRRAFHGAATLVLIGDPKQAIYAFRGADVHAYLAAAAVAGHRATLALNWRSDPDLLAGLDALFRGAALGDPRIVVTPVRAGHPGRSLDTAGEPVPVRIRVIGRDDHRGNTTPAVGVAREKVVADVTAEIAAVLEAAPAFRPRDGSPPRPLRPGDLAVIVRTNAQLDLVHAALTRAGIPSVQRTTASVFRSAAAADWLILLEALDQPHRSGRVRRLALTPFIGWDAGSLTESNVDDLGLRLRHWLRMFDERGVAALFETMSRDERLPARLLRQINGERRLTDLRHVGETLHAAAMSGQLGLTALLEWLRRRIAESDEDSSVERSRRLDSDAAAVQLVTVHASKGLEFPIVYVPFGWDRFSSPPGIPLFHDGAGRRVRNVGGERSPGFAQDQARDDSEQFGEDLRLLYVALTRAQAQVTAWWAPAAKNTPCSPLHRLLFADDPAAEIPERIKLPSDAVAQRTIEGRAVPGRIEVEVAHPRDPATWQRPAVAAAALTAASLGRAVDIAWRRTSYTALTASVHDLALGSEPEQRDTDDEPGTPMPPAPAEQHLDPLQRATAPMMDLPAGADFGTLVHAVLEHADPTAADLDRELHGHVATLLPRLGPPDVDAAALAAALIPALRTPLGPLTGDAPLTAFRPADRLAELEFELPLRGGDRPNGTSTLRELAGLLRRHLTAGDPLAGYAAFLDDPVLGATTVRGYLTGSIDAVLRRDGRYVVVDYKTNRLGSPDSPLSAWHYRRSAMTDAMLRAHYPLQALLYQVALHRFLRWRLTGYDPDKHLGGVLYLFLRGMCGPGVTEPNGAVPGVFSWSPPPALVVAVSDALARGAA